MSQEPDLESMLPPTVDAVLGVVSAVSGLLVPPDRDAFTMSVLLNALAAALEGIGERSPEEYVYSQRIALSMLRTGPDASAYLRTRSA